MYTSALLARSGLYSSYVPTTCAPTVVAPTVVSPTVVPTVAPTVTNAALRASATLQAQQNLRASQTLATAALTGSYVPTTTGLTGYPYGWSGLGGYGAYPYGYAGRVGYPYTGGLYTSGLGYAGYRGLGYSGLGYAGLGRSYLAGGLYRSTLGLRPAVVAPTTGVTGGDDAEDAVEVPLN